VVHRGEQMDLPAVASGAPQRLAVDRDRPSTPWPTPSRWAARPTRWCTQTAAAQFRSHAFARALRAAGLQGSMGRVGACADNAAMESFFSLLQKNVLNRRRWTTHDQLRLAIVTWIERTYHRRRRQDALGRLTPIEFETLLNTAHPA
jgi:transposase InsO family protein